MTGNGVWKKRQLLTGWKNWTKEGKTPLLLSSVNCQLWKGQQHCTVQWSVGDDARSFPLSEFWAVWDWWLWWRWWWWWSSTSGHSSVLFHPLLHSSSARPFYYSFCPHLLIRQFVWGLVIRGQSSQCFLINSWPQIVIMLDQCAKTLSHSFTVLWVDIVVIFAVITIIVIFVIIIIIIIIIIIAISISSTRKKCAPQWQ